MLYIPVLPGIIITEYGNQAHLTYSEYNAYDLFILSPLSYRNIPVHIICFPKTGKYDQYFFHYLRQVTPKRVRGTRLALLSKYFVRQELMHLPSFKVNEVLKLHDKARAYN